MTDPGKGRPPVTTRPSLRQLGLDTGKKARLHRILHEHGLRNGTAIFLPYDQGLEHGPRDFFANPASSDPSYIMRLAIEGGFNGIAVQIGLAEKFYTQLREVALLCGTADVEGVSDGVGAEPDGLGDLGVQRRQRLGVGRNVGLAVELEDQGHLAGIVPVRCGAMPNGSACH
jgi:hypothetical protein